MKTIWNDMIPYVNVKQMKGHYDVVVIGAGLCGLLCAHKLKQKGYEVAVLEANTVMSGQSNKTTAKITSQHGLIYSHLSTFLDERLIKQYAMANEKAIYEYEKMIKEFDIECDFKRCKACLYTCEDDGVDKLHKEYEVAERVGIKALLDTHTELPFFTKEALYFMEQASFDPMKFVKGFVNNLEIYEHVLVTKVDDHVIYFKGGSVEASHIVFASHFPFINFPGYYFMRMYQERSYVVVGEKQWKLKDMYYGIDDDAISYRGYYDMILFCNENHRTGVDDEKHYKGLREKAKLKKGEFICEWSAQDCMTLDGIPYIGYFTSGKDYWHVATGFNKWGMTSAMVAACITVDHVSGLHSPYEEVFDPSRIHIEVSMKSFWNNIKHSAKGLILERFTSLKDIHELPLEHGGVVMVNDMRVGVYKKNENEIYIVDICCPHMRCQLEWNAEEKSWDCPCHGSRFSYDGTLIDGPSHTSLKSVSIK